MNLWNAMVCCMPMNILGINIIYGWMQDRRCLLSSRVYPMIVNLWVHYYDYNCDSVSFGITTYTYDLWVHYLWLGAFGFAVYTLWLWTFRFTTMTMTMTWCPLGSLAILMTFGFTTYDWMLSGRYLCLCFVHLLLW